ncbi:hypothetical protein [Longimicrobium sp.]
MAGKADLVNGIADGADGTVDPSSDPAYASLSAAEAAGGEPGRGWVADG